MNLPLDRTAELGVIGASLDGGLETVLEAGEMLPSRCFYHDDCRFVFEAIQSASKTGQLADMIGICSLWRANFPAIDFPTEFYSAIDEHPKWTLRNRAETVLDLYRRRQAMIASCALMEGAERLHDPLADTMAEFDALMDQSETNAPPILDGKALAIQLHQDLERRFNLQGGLSGIDTGFSDLNKFTDGLQAGEVWILGARPNVGKTALALNIAEHVAITHSIPCLFVSLEMSAVALSRRLFSMRQKMNGNDIRSGKLGNDGFKHLGAFNARLKEAPFYIVDAPGGIKINQLCHSIRAAIKRWKIRVVFIDYLQKIRPDSKGEKRTYEIGDTSAQLVELTKRENINLFALAQLNRESEKEKGRSPRLSDLADSKAIEADADFVGLLERPINGYETQALLKIAKQRDGKRGNVLLTFDGRYCRFRSGTNQESPQI